MMQRTIVNTLRASCRPATSFIFPGLAWRQSFITVRESGLPTAEGKEKKVVFDKTSSPELDSVLTEILHKIILPAHLPQQKAKLISAEKNRQVLAVDPVIIEVDGYEHRFDVLDFKKGHIPKTTPLVRDALRLMQTREDWANLVRLLSGLNMGKRKFLPVDFQLMLQQAGKTGNMYAVIDALARSKNSGLEVATHNQADHVLVMLASMAINSGYAWNETKRASGWASQFMEIVAATKHSWLFKEPQVIGQALHLAAAESVFHFDGKDPHERVVELAKLLVEEWRFKTEKVERPDHGRPLGLLDLHQSKEDSIQSGAGRLKAHGKALWYLHLDPSRHIAIASCMIRGIEWASQVVPQLAGKLQPIREGLEYELQQHVPNRDGEYLNFKGRRIPAKMGWSIYDALMVEGDKPVNWGPTKQEVEAEFAQEEPVDDRQNGEAGKDTKE